MPSQSVDLITPPDDARSLAEQQIPKLRWHPRLDELAPVLHNEAALADRIEGTLARLAAQRLVDLQAARAAESTHPVE